MLFHCHIGFSPEVWPKSSDRNAPKVSLKARRARELADEAPALSSKSIPSIRRILSGGNHEGCVRESVLRRSKLELTQSEGSVSVGQLWASIMR